MSQTDPVISIRCTRNRLFRAGAGVIGTVLLVAHVLPHRGSSWLQTSEPPSQQSLKPHLRVAQGEDKGGHKGVDGEEMEEGVSFDSSDTLPPCEVLNVEAAKAELVCFPKCKPAVESTLEGMGLNPNERVNITVMERQKSWTSEYGKYRMYFPEEDIYLNLTVYFKNHFYSKASGSNQPIRGQDTWQPRAFTERLLRRIVARLFRAGIMDPSHDIVNTGSWIGDNALPWALLLQNINPTNPGKIIAVDPSVKFVTNMVDMSTVNGIGNLCTRIGVFSAKEENFTVNGLEHISLKNGGITNGKITLTAIPLDSLKLQHLSLLHLDVEGHENEVIEGALWTINTTRPIVITEGYDVWPDPKDDNDKKVLKSMTSLGYLWYDVIPEQCGWAVDARNIIWWPDEETREKAMAVVGKEFQRPVLPWVSFDLPEEY